MRQSERLYTYISSPIKFLFSLESFSFAFNCLAKDQLLNYTGFSPTDCRGSEVYAHI